MKLLIKQRMFTITDHYHVYDETGEIRYEVEDEFFRLGHQIHVYDKRSGREVGSIHQKLFTWMPEFEIVIDGRVMGTIRKQMTFFVPKYQVDYRGWSVEGDLMGWDYQVMRGEVPVMSISKELLNWTDTYSLQYSNPADEIPGLLLVVAIDAVNCSKNK